MMLTGSALGALGVLGGIASTRTSEEFDTKSDEWQKVLKWGGMALYVVGWLLLGFFGAGGSMKLADHLKPEALLVWGSVLGVLVASALKEFKDKEAWLQKLDPLVITVLLGASWIIFGSAVGYRGRSQSARREGLALGLTAAVLAVASLVAVLPWQREHMVVDGPGHPMLTLALTLVAYLISR